MSSTSEGTELFMSHYLHELLIHGILRSFNNNPIISFSQNKFTLITHGLVELELEGPY